MRRKYESGGPQKAPRALDSEAIEADAGAALAEFGGDAGATIRAFLFRHRALAADVEAVVSRGYVRGIASKSAQSQPTL
jgi:hypothetical protein